MAGTTRLLDEHGFLWRSLYNAAGRKIPSVQLIEVGDTIHVYVPDDGVEHYVASYLVEQPADLADATVPAVESVPSGALADLLDEAGYEKDPELGCFTGFRVKRDLFPRPLDQTPHWFGRNAIVRVKR